MFGSTINKPASGNLFGGAPSTSGLFSNSGVNSIDTNQPVSDSSSGQNAGTTQSQPGGLFGSTQPATNGLFGQTATVTSQPQSNGLFSTATPNPTGTTGLFGNVTTSQSGQMAGLFGSTSALSQPQQSGGNLFGQTNKDQNPPTTNLLLSGNLGNQNKPSPPQQSNTSADPSVNNGLSQGPQSSRQQQTVPGVLIDVSNIRGTTRFNDLREELRKQIMEIDTMIQSQIQLKNDCDAIMPAHDSQLSQIPTDVEFCQRKLIGVDNAADSDIHAISAVQKLIKSDAKAAKLSFAAIDILRLPPQYYMSGAWTSKSNSRGNGEAGDIVGFFSLTADELGSKLSMYRKHISEIEQHLRGVEANSAHQLSILVAKKNGNSSVEESSFDQLAGVLRDFETGLLNVAGKVGATRKSVTALQLNQLSSPISNPRN